MYDFYLPNVTGWETKETVMQHIFPTTPVELGPGWIVGRERIVSKVAREFEFKPGQLQVQCSFWIRFYATRMILAPARDVRAI
jgi:hypothetical protein